MRVSIEIEIPGLESVLKEARGDRTLHEIGTAAGMSHDNIKLVEGTRKARPNPLVPLPTLLKVAAAVGVDIKPEVIQAMVEAIKAIAEN